MRRRKRGRNTGDYFGPAPAPLPGSRAVPLPGTFSQVAHARRTAEVNSEFCIGCGRCVAVCPTGAISLTPAGTAVVNTGVCQGCAACAADCPVGAISLLTPALTQQQ